MSMYGSRGYRGFYDSLQYADFKRKSDREEALIERGEPRHFASLSDWDDDAEHYRKSTVHFEDGSVSEVERAGRRS